MSLIACAVLAIAAIAGNIMVKSDKFIPGNYRYYEFFDKVRFRVTFTPDHLLVHVKRNRLKLAVSNMLTITPYASGVCFRHKSGIHLLLIPDESLSVEEKLLIETYQRQMIL
jgi:hypothetical protein